jgi:hypothetical protein
MTSRILPVAEWARLAHTPLAGAALELDPERTSILVIEDGDHIVGCWAMCWCLHAECLWIDPPKRKRGGVLRKLLREMGRFAPTVFSVVDPEAEALAVKFGGIALEGPHYVIPLGDV